MSPSMRWLLRHMVFVLLLGNSLVAAFQITGISAGVDPSTGARPLRTEINQFSQSGAAFDLFILALQQYEASDQSTLLSYFQIAGIHGYPHIPWDGVAGSYDYPGFCMHASVPFPTWHRPYLALYEQVLWNNAQIIARKYPTSQQDAYVAAAATLRVPYWDWAALPNLPAVVASPTIQVNTPDRGLTTINNPLYQYTFQSDAAGNGFPVDDITTFPTTVRHWNGSASDQGAANAALLSQASSMISLTYQMFTLATNWDAFSCTSPGGGSNAAYNLENPHNSIHVNVGGDGHMSYPEVAAFDPIFWLHHANVDRLFAMWQTQYPNAFIEPTVNTYGSYYEAVGTVDAGNSSLAPFHSDNGSDLYTSDDVRGTRRFGYTYPEIIDWNVSPSDLAASVRNQINALYNPAASGGSSKRRLAARRAKSSQGWSDIGFGLANDLGVNNLDMLWSIVIDLDRFAFRTAFSIDFFMGKPPSDPASWGTAPNLVGSHSQFIAHDVPGMHPGGVPPGRVLGAVSLSHTLAAGVARALVHDLTPRSVVPLLTRDLHWKARTLAGAEVDVSSLTGLKISVTSRKVTPATSGSEFPTYGEVRQHPGITRGKAGGAQ